MKTEVNPTLEKDICMHIFGASSAMVGVCLTVIGIIQLRVQKKGIETLADDFLAFDALLFLASSLLSYFALRKRSSVRLHRVEIVADYVFIVGLVFMVFNCMFMVYSLTVG